MYQPKTQEERVDLLMWAKVPLWRGCVLASDQPGEWMTAIRRTTDGSRWCLVDYNGRTCIGNGTPDPSAPENFPHLLAELARRKGLDPSRGIILWRGMGAAPDLASEGSDRMPVRGGWWLSARGDTVLLRGTADPFPPDDDDGALDVLCAALAEVGP